MNDKMKNLVIRSLSGAVLGVVVLGAILWSQWSFGALLLVLSLAGMHEFYALCERRGEAPQRVLGLLSGALLFALNFAFVSDDIRILGPAGHAFGSGMAFLLLLMPLLFVCELYRKRENPAANIAVTLLGVVYVALPFSLLLYLPILSTDAWTPWVVVAYVAIIWVNDVCAYLVGMTVGRRKLFERLSPKKSWEGFFGGLAGAVGAGLAAGHLLGASLAAWAGLALVAAVVAVAGDLAESMFKRAAGVKDSGSLIPGHGGVLDRFDAMLLSAPFVFVYMIFVM
ncbi:phosphatidate cytidylyltransferase [Alistipes sp.]|uniref:phosphatidate cytidylyltransferase n=1 Tax=Alistipes sp. TaxID=1872444 RepID=UPI0025BF894D|nr:phosphatidate cytidylyltransferase [Alistipes sp.]